MPNARQKILNYIIEQQSTTVEELSKVFRVTPANIRHHLSILVDQGSVNVIGQKAQPLKGRPAQIYSSSRLNECDNLDQLSGALLSNLLINSQPHEMDQAIREIARIISSEVKTDTANPTRRLYSTIRSLNHMNYLAHWEAHVENPRLMLGHCPYRPILAKHPELCQMDTYLLENLLGTQVRQTEKLTLNTKGLSQCVFLIKRTTSGKSLYTE